MQAVSGSRPERCIDCTRDSRHFWHVAFARLVVFGVLAPIHWMLWPLQGFCACWAIVVICAVVLSVVVLIGAITGGIIVLLSQAPYMPYDPSGIICIIMVVAVIFVPPTILVLQSIPQLTSAYHWMTSTKCAAPMSWASFIVLISVGFVSILCVVFDYMNSRKQQRVCQSRRELLNIDHCLLQSASKSQSSVAIVPQEAHVQSKNDQDCDQSDVV